MKILLQLFILIQGEDDRDLLAFRINYILLCSAQGITSIQVSMFLSV